ncbi:MAG: putative Two-component hybrid sensor and regulator [Actinomycetia bacterium]|nr:putative Two-component hybrid sensor and regulator [Actinomycetes bacterium]
MNTRESSDSSHQILLDALDEGFVFQDLEGRVVLSNPAASRLLGLSAEVLTGRSPKRPEWDVTFEDGGRDRERFPSIVALRTGKRISDVVMRIEHPDGRDIWLSVTAQPVFDGDANGSQATGVVVSFSDITERRTTEHELRDAERRVRQLLELAQVGIWTIDADGMTTYANDWMAELLGRSAAEMVGIDFFQFMDAEVRAIAERNPAGRQLGHGENSDFKFVRPDGTPVWTIMSTSPILDESAAYFGALVIVTDVTERRHVQADLRDAELDRQRRAAVERHTLEAELLRSQRLESLGRLAAGIAHDFNNVLGVILNYADFVTKRLDPSDPIATDVSEIRRAAERATELTRQLLLFGHSEVLQASVFDLSNAVDEAMPMFRRTLGHVDLVVELPSEPTPVFADRGQIEQVLMNLVLNARDAISARGTVTVRVRRHDQPNAHGNETVELSVTDEGEGMTPEVVDRAFEPFFTTKTRDRGSGLGLASAHGIVVRAGGEIGIETEPGVGTCVSITLPLAETDAEQLPVSNGTAGTEGSSNMVLVVDDEPEVRAVTVRILRENGYRVVEAQSGLDALARLTADAAAAVLILTDVVMPEMSGPDLAHEVHASYPEMKVVLMSGYAYDELGADDSRRAKLLTKPFNEDQLLRAVHGALHAPTAA